jgi:hypothetical protein
VELNVQPASTLKSTPAASLRGRGISFSRLVVFVGHNFCASSLLHNPDAAAASFECSKPAACKRAGCARSRARCARIPVLQGIHLRL